MKKLQYLLVTALLSLTLIAAAPAASIGPWDGGPVIFGGNYTVRSGETVDTDLVVFGGNVTVEEGGRVKGSIVIFGGNVTMDGSVDNDVVVIGGAGSLGEKAVINGDLVSVGGSISRADGAIVEGDFIEESAIEIPIPGAPDLPVPTRMMRNPVGNALGIVGRAAGLTVLAMLLMLFLRPQMERVAQAVVSQPLMTGGVGLLTVILFPLAFVILLITIVLPIVLVFVLILAWLLGFVSLGMEVGERFTKALDQTWAPVLSAGFGSFLLAMVTESVALIPCVGWVAPALLALVGIGAVALTWFGTRGYPPVGAAPAAGVSSEAQPSSS